MAAKETQSQRIERLSTCEIGGIVAPSLHRSEVVAHRKMDGEGSLYRVVFCDGSVEERVSLSRVKNWLREDLAAEALR